MPFGIKLVIDHLGHPDARLSVDQPGFPEMLELGLSTSTTRVVDRPSLHSPSARLAPIRYVALSGVVGK
ncbi:hypothetical protein DBR45_02585 [Pseudomonas sp. HMWF031]|nr:hypothetical protein DBR45_02585 [Pseudomonas sp. HMWF031]